MFVKPQELNQKLKDEKKAKEEELKNKK